MLPARLVLNAISATGPALGLANIALAWWLLRATADADIWMAALALVQTLSLLSQMGVEQVAVFSARVQASEGTAGAHRFNGTAHLWSVLFGVVFFLLVLAGREQIVNLFVPGFSPANRARLETALGPLLLLVGVAPSLYLLRQLLLLQGRLRTALAIGAQANLAQFLALGACLLAGITSPIVLTWATAGVALTLWILSVAVGHVGFGAAAARDARMREMVIASFQLRSVSSIHNFAVAFISSSTLSMGPTGSVAVFQWVKRITDGLAAVSYGPHLLVYQAAQASAWAEGKLQLLKSNAADYLRISVPTFLLVAVGVVAGTAIALQVGALGEAGPMARQILPLLVLLLAWHLVISIETVCVAMVVVDHRWFGMLVINLVFVTLYYVFLQRIHALPPVLSVAAFGVACQLVSAAAFTWLAGRILSRRFGRARA